MRAYDFFSSDPYPNKNQDLYNQVKDQLGFEFFRRFPDFKAKQYFRTENIVRWSIKCQIFITSIKRNMGLQIGITLHLNPVMKHLTFSVFNTHNKCHFCIDLGTETFVKTKVFQEARKWKVLSSSKTVLQKWFVKTDQRSKFLFLLSNVLRS